MIKDKDKILTCLQQHQKDFFDMLKEFIELESPSHEDKETSDKCSQFLEKAFRELGFRIERIPQSTCGDHIYGEIGTGEGSALILGHYDTVFPLGTIKTMPFKMEDGKAYGPGILDMKGGIVMAYFALKALIELGLMPEKKIGIFFNGDEESGSFCSSDIIIEKTQNYNCVLVMEPGINDFNAIKTKRYGRGTYDIIAHGKAAHSGSNSHLAISPLMEIARQLLYIEKWNDETEGVTFTPTVVSGGIAGTCMVPETAYLTMDVRYQTEEIAETIHKKIMNLKALTPNVRLEVQGKIDKPVMVGDKELYQKTLEIGKQYGLELKGITVGGGSDGNFTAAAGIPTLDGLGATGEFLHNSGEYIHIDHVPYRMAMVAKLLQTL
ncbi:M20 family metallopeptidase [Sinanaerobacter chloroacetimidivorans]|uniref:M20 family metallopeptidase n=1 Tax=Sinanaerobacter chloroacetimidivorans TaxID=2818044 RepID=A0A8J8B1K2_9FIRM|nr:M20 family metallopeptidase [Sinanaerobacter chloroacetimidivorans]MBR0597817.1 M20 family metallopeptidase [Sinanaerobacter chloroacetimidivorans]